jgi:DNA-binding NarL/FixJ family response regulator
MAFDYSIKRIAETMGIAESTVQNKRMRIYDKLGVYTSGGAVAAALRARWIR